MFKNKERKQKSKGFRLRVRAHHLTDVFDDLLSHSRTVPGLDAEAVRDAGVVNFHDGFPVVVGALAAGSAEPAATARHPERRRRTPRPCRRHGAVGDVGHGVAAAAQADELIARFVSDPVILAAKQEVQLGTRRPLLLLQVTWQRCAPQLRIPLVVGDGAQLVACHVQRLPDAMARLDEGRGRPRGVFRHACDELDQVKEEGRGNPEGEERREHVEDECDPGYREQRLCYVSLVDQAAAQIKRLTENFLPLSLFAMCVTVGNRQTAPTILPGWSSLTSLVPASFTFSLHRRRISIAT